MDTSSREDVEKFEVCFTSDDWMRMYGGPLRYYQQAQHRGLSQVERLDAEDRVLHLLESSAFFDKSSNNVTVWQQQKPLEALTKLTGLEYIMLHPRAPVAPPEADIMTPLIISRQRRSGPEVVVREALYYMMDETIYQSPNLHKLCTSRLRKCIEHLQSAFNMLQGSVKYSQVLGYHISTAAPLESEEKPKSENEIPQGDNKPATTTTTTAATTVKKSRKRRHRRRISPEQEMKIGSILKTLEHNFQANEGSAPTGEEIGGNKRVRLN